MTSSNPNSGVNWGNLNLGEECIEFMTASHPKKPIFSLNPNQMLEPRAISNDLIIYFRSDKAEGE